MAPDNATSGDQEDLAAVLRQLREASGLTGDRLAVRVGVSQSKISKIETGRSVPSLLDVERILAALEVPAAARSEIMTLARAANVSFTAWRTVRQAGVAKRQAQVAAIEQSATVVRVFQPALVPGLLQTPEYARAVLSLPRLAGERDLMAAVAQRMERQTILYDTRQFRFLLMEAVLRTRLVRTAAMQAQLEHITTVSRLPNVEVGIVPQEVPLPEVPSNAIALLDDRVVITETFAGEMVQRDPRDVELHAEIFEAFAAVALCKDDARGRLAEVVEALLL